MKILIFSPGFNKYVIGLANALSSTNSVIVMLPINGVTRDEIDALSNKVKFEPYHKPRQSSLKSIIMINKIWKKIKSNDPEIIHLMAHGHLWLIFVWPLIRRYKVFNTLHDVTSHLGQERWSYKLRTLFGIFYTNHFMVHGQALKKKLIKTTGISEHKVSVITKGNYSFYLRYFNEKITEEKNTILFFGRLKEYKGLKYLMKAEPIISKEIPEIKILIHVHGGDFSRYEKYMINKEKYEVVLGYLDDRKVTESFQRSSLIVLPYAEASQTGIVHIAYPLRKPVVVTSVGALPETVIDGKTGFIVPPRDEEKLAEAIIKILNNDKLRFEMGMNAYNYAMEVLSWEKVAEETNEIFKQKIS